MKLQLRLGKQGVFVDNAFRSADKQQTDIIQKAWLQSCFKGSIVFK